MSAEKQQSRVRKVLSAPQNKAEPLAMSDGLVAAMACANGWLCPPADWRYWYEALELIRPVVNLRIQLADSDLVEMQALLHAINEIVEQRQVVGSNFPMAIKPMKENSEQGICWDYPLYAIFLTSTAKTAAQWTAMVATMLPTLVVLHQKAQALPDTFRSRSYQACKELRYLAWAQGTALSILMDLPIEANNAVDFLTEIRAIAEMAKIGIASTGDFAPFYPVFRVLEWFNAGAPDWPKRARTGTGGGGGIHRQNTESDRARPRYDSAVLEDFERDAGADPSKSDFTHVKGFSRFFADVPTAELAPAKSDWAIRSELPVSDFACEVHVDRTLANYHQVRRAQALRSAKYGAQALTLAAQRLPVANNLPSGFEMEVLLKALDNTGDEVWHDVPPKQRKVAAAYVGYRLAFSRGHSDAMEVVAVRGADTGKSKSWNVDSNEFRLSVQSPSHSYPEFVEHTVAVAESFTLPAPLLLKRLFAPLHDRVGSLFAVNCERHLRSLLSAINQKFGTELTPNKMQAWIARRMELLCNGDQVVSTYFCGKAPAGHMPAVYSAVAISMLQDTFHSAFWQLKEITGCDIAAPMQLAIADRIDDASPQVGTRHLVKTTVIQKTVVDLRTEIEAMYSTPGVGFAERHNIYTAYSLFIYLALTGTRPLQHFLPLVEAIDLTDGLAFTSEKDNAQYSYSRLTVVCSLLKAQLLNHVEHLRLLRSHLALVNPAANASMDAWIQVSDLTSIGKPDRNIDLQRLAGLAHFFSFIDPQNGALIAPSAEILQSYLGVEWQLRIYTLRHHFRTFLMRRSFAAEALDYGMGHMDSRMQPLGLCSTMPTSIWSSGLAKEMETLCADLGIKAMPSPLQPYRASASES